MALVGAGGQRSGEDPEQETPTTPGNSSASVGELIFMMLDETLQTSTTAGQRSHPESLGCQLTPPASTGCAVPIADPVLGAGERRPIRTAGWLPASSADPGEDLRFRQKKPNPTKVHSKAK